MEADLALKKIPARVKELIVREAQSHRRSINQEAIVLLEEALEKRMAKPQRGKQEEVQAILDHYAALPKRGKGKAADVIEYDEAGLPK